MDESKSSTEKSAQGPTVYYQPLEPSSTPGYYGQPPGDQQQQQPYVVVQQQQQPTVVIMGAPPGKSFATHMALACCACWCCGGLFGLAAFIVAFWARKTYRVNPQHADLLGKVSLVLSAVGLTIGLIILAYYLVNFVMGVHWLYIFIRDHENSTIFWDEANYRDRSNGTLLQNSTRA